MHHVERTVAVAAQFQKDLATYDGATVGLKTELGLIGLVGLGALGAYLYKQFAK